MDRRNDALKARGVLAAIAAVTIAVSVAGRAAAQDLKPDDVRREVGYIALQDGVRLAHVLYLPPEGDRFPALLTFNPYSGGGLPLIPQVMAFLRNGYAVLSVSIRGTGCSEGIYPILEQQGKDGAEVVEWAARQSWCTGAVGMFGNSYAGTIQLEVAAQRPAPLKAMSAGGLTGDGYSELAYPGGMLNTYLAWWSYVAQVAAAKYGVQSRVDMGDAECAEKRAAQPPLWSFEAAKQHPLRDALWESAALLDRIESVDVPLFVFHGWQDQQVPALGATRYFQRVKGPKKMLLSNGDHGFYGWNRSSMESETIRWYDRWLKGEDNGVDREPPVTVWFETQFGVEGPFASPSWIERFSDWPAKETSTTNLYLTADHQLSRARPSSGGESGELKYFYPYSTEIVATNETFSMPPMSLGSVTYRTPPMTEDTMMLGVPTLTLYLSSEQPDTDIMAVLHDVDPEGKTLYLQRGFLRASHRRIDSERSRPSDLYFAHDREELLEPGKVYEIRFPLYPVGHVVRAGHRLELAIMTPPVVAYPNWGFVIKTLPGMVTIHHSQDHPSVLELPVIPHLTAKAPAPTCGSLRLQPCRKAPELDPWQGR